MDEKRTKEYQTRFTKLGLSIAAVRKQRGFTQEQLAEKAMISRSHLSAIESPRITRSFSLEILYLIADALEVDAGDLLSLQFLPDIFK